MVVSGMSDFTLNAIGLPPVMAGQLSLDEMPYERRFRGLVSSSELPKALNHRPGVWKQLKHAGKTPPVALTVGKTDYYDSLAVEQWLKPRHRLCALLGIAITKQQWLECLTFSQCPQRAYLPPRMRIQIVENATGERWWLSRSDVVRVAHRFETQEVFAHWRDRWWDISAQDKQDILAQLKTELVGVMTLPEVREFSVAVSEGRAEKKELEAKIVELVSLRKKERALHQQALLLELECGFSVDAQEVEQIDCSSWIELNRFAARHMEKMFAFASLVFRDGVDEHLPGGSKSRLREIEP